MDDKTKTQRKPSIRISKTDHARLSVLAATVAARNPDISDELLSELERARVVADGSIANDVIQMGSTVTFKPLTGDAKTVTLVFPGDADISQGKISILTPIGTALLGLSAGQEMSWSAPDGRRHALSVLAVERSVPAAAGDQAPAVAAGA